MKLKKMKIVQKIKKNLMMNLKKNKNKTILVKFYSLILV
jgi:hypothetical protein